MKATKKKQQIITLRVKAEELERIDKDAASLDMSRSDYLRLLLASGVDRLTVDYMRAEINALIQLVNALDVTKINGRLGKLLEVAGECNAYTKAHVKSLNGDYLPEVEEQVKRIKDFTKKLYGVHHEQV